MNFGRKIAPPKFECVIILIIAFCLLSSAFRNPDLPGLYLDAVNPDYIAVQLLNRTAAFTNDNWVIASIGNIPILIQLYHGAVTTFVMTFALLLTGTASILKLHLVNAGYGFIACVLSYVFLKKLHVNRWIAGGTVIALATTASLNTIFRTQYYIKLPGTILLLAALLLLAKARELQEQGKFRRMLAWSGFAAGLAFYSYFIYLFFVPAFIVFICLMPQLNVWEKRPACVLTWSLGYVLGSMLYILGYAKLGMSTFLSGGEMKIVLVIMAVILPALLLRMIYLLVRCRLHGWRVKLYGAISCCASCGALLLMILFKDNWYPVLHKHAVSLNIAGHSISLLQRLIRLKTYLCAILSNSVGETMIFGTTVSVWPNFYFTVLLLTASAALVLAIGNRKNGRSEIHGLSSCLILLGSYFLCALPFSSRLGTQHFVPVLFLSFITMGVSIGIIADTLHAVTTAKVAKTVLIMSFVAMLTLNLINQGLFQYNLSLSGGIGYYSEQLNELAYKANENKAAGDSEVYIFEEWGFMANFCYLTNNNVKYLTSCDENTLNSYLNKGYHVVYCSWSEEGISAYEKTINSLGDNMDQECKVWKNRDNSPAFYTLSCKQKPPC